MTISKINTAGVDSNLSLSGNTSLESLVVSGTTTFAQGTVNGLLYLNGSKVAASGSLLTFDGTNLLVGTDSVSIASGAAIAVYNSTIPRIKLTNASTGTTASDGCELSVVGTDFYINNRESSNTIFNVAGSEQARLTSKGLLVGYTSDGLLSGTGNAIFSGSVWIGSNAYSSYKLDVVDSVCTQRLNSTSTASGDAPTLTFWHSGNDIFTLKGGSGLKFLAGGSTQVMTINSSGNVGIGTSSPSTKLDVRSTGTDGIRSGQSTPGAGNDPNFELYHANNFGFRWRLDNLVADLHLDSNSSGTWANDVMTVIRSSGNVGIGTSSPIAKLNVNSVASTGPTNGICYLRSQTSTYGTTNESNAFTTIYGTNGSNSASVQFGIGVPATYGHHDTGFMRLHAANVWAPSSGVLKFSSSGTTVGSGDVSYKGFEFYNNQSDNQNAFWFYHNVGSGSGSTFQIYSAKTSNLDTQVLRVTSAGGANFNVNNTGNVGIGTSSPGSALEIKCSRTSSTSAVCLTLSDNVTGGQTNGVYKAIRSISNNGSSISEIRFLETDGTNNNTGLVFATQAVAGGLTERLRIDNTGLLTLAQGQIKFPATQNASADANTLDDYEEGTWTPVLKRVDSTVNANYTVTYATYVKIGRLVTVKAYFNSVNCSVANGSSYWGVFGFPFQPTQYSATFLGYNNMSVNSGYVGDGAGMYLTIGPSVQTTAPTGTAFMLNLTYETST